MPGCCPHEHDDSIRGVSPQVIESPPARVFGLDPSCDQDRSLHAVPALGVSRVALGGVFGKHPLREPVELEPTAPCRTAYEKRIRCELHQHRCRIGRPIAVEVPQHASDVRHGASGGEAVQHDGSHLCIVRLANRHHQWKAKRLKIPSRSLARERTYHQGNRRYLAE